MRPDKYSCPCHIRYMRATVSEDQRIYGRSTRRSVLQIPLAARPGPSLSGISFVFGANTELPTPPRTPPQTSSSLFSQVTNVPCQITVPAGPFAGTTSSGTVAHKMVEHAQITTQNVIAGGLGEGGQFVQGRATSDSAQSHTTDFRLELDGFVC